MQIIQVEIQDELSLTQRHRSSRDHRSAYKVPLFTFFTIAPKVPDDCFPLIPMLVSKHRTPSCACFCESRVGYGSFVLIKKAVHDVHQVSRATLGSNSSRSDSTTLIAALRMTRLSSITLFVLLLNLLFCDFLLLCNLKRMVKHYLQLYLRLSVLLQTVQARRQAHAV